jgi:hypothetical protein
LPLIAKSNNNIEISKDKTMGNAYVIRVWKYGLKERSNETMKTYTDALHMDSYRAFTVGITVLHR